MSIVRCYFDQDLRCGIDGLLLELKKKKIAASALKTGDLIVFMNRSRTIFKMLSGTNHLVVYKSPRGRVKVDDIKSVSKIFSDTQFKTQKLDRSTTKFLGNGATLYHDGEELRVVV